MPRKCSAQLEIEQFKIKGRELITLAISIVAGYDEKETLPRASAFTLRHRAIILLEGAISFVEILLRLKDCGDGGLDIKG